MRIRIPNFRRAFRRVPSIYPFPREKCANLRSVRRVLGGLSLKVQVFDPDGKDNSMRNAKNHWEWADPESDDATAATRHRQPRWGRLALAALLAAAAATYAIGREFAKRIEKHDIEVATRRQPPAPGFPESSRTDDNNNMIMRMGLVGDLDGQAIAYTAEAARLVRDGKFRIDLPLDRMAELLRVSPHLLATARSPNEVDPNAELFRAQSGTLTVNAKTLSRASRGRQAREGKKPDAVYPDWVITNYSFTLNRLNVPSADEKVVLAAIKIAAAETMPRPGDKVRAVGVAQGELASGRIALAVGMLPLE